MDEPRILTRALPFELSREATDGDGLTLEGYAAVFNTPTRIDSWEGTFDEQIARGAFKKTLSERTPVLQFDHGRHPLVGSIPLGSIEKLREDSHGLHVVARLHDNWLIEPVRDAIRSGSVDGMSFRFQVVKDEWKDRNGKTLTPQEIKDLLWNPGERGPLVRTIQEIRLFEVGPVVFPAYEATSVKVRDIDLGDPAVRAELARLLLSGTSEKASEDEGSSAVEEAARTEEPREHSEDPVPDLSRYHALVQEGIIR